MPYPELKVGPQDLDGAGALAADLGTHNQAHVVINQVARMYPRELVASAVLPPDQDRTEALDAGEVEELARDEGLLGKKDVVVEGSPKVRGRTDSERVVHFLVQTESGRTGRAILPYAELSRSARAHERLLEERKAEGGSPAVLTDDDATEAVKAAQERADAEEARRAELEDRVKELEKAAQDPPPFEGYDEANGDEIVERVKSGGREEFGQRGLERIRDYESRNEGRKGVLTAVEKALGG